MICEKCGNEMVIKESQYGKFWACTSYPDCTNTKRVTQPKIMVTANDQKDFSAPVVRPGDPVKTNGHLAMYVSYVKDLIVSGKTKDEAIAIVKQAMNELR